MASVSRKQTLFSPLNHCEVEYKLAYIILYKCRMHCVQLLRDSVLCCFVLACSLLLESPFVAKYTSLPELMSCIAQCLQKGNPSSVQCALKVLEGLNSYLQVLTPLIVCLAFLLLHAFVAVVRFLWSAKSESLSRSSAESR